jgi:4-hydroxy-tetrahydrodipicolinate synthase
VIELPADRLRGSFTPLVTPFADGAVDHEAFERSVLRQIDAGAPGVVLTGTTGEPTSLTAAERAELYRRAVAVADRRIQVVAATGSASQRETFELTEAAERAGVDAVLVVVPAFVKPSQEGLVRHFVAVAERTELPFLIYDIPGRAAVGASVATVVRVAEARPNLVGLKHASTNLDAITELLLALGGEFRVFCGLESFSYPMLALGAAGLMNAVGNVAPERVVALCDAVTAGDHAAALAIHRELFDVNRAIFFDTNPVPLKRMLSRLGVGSEEVRAPLAPLDEATRARVDAVVDALAPVVAAP